ncbi:MAG: xylulokinase [Promethearchaeota archaeon]
MSLNSINTSKDNYSNEEKNLANKNNLKYIIAIDHGTSGIKAALVSVFGEVVAWEFQKTPIKLFENRGAEQDPNDWWFALKNSIKNLLDKKNKSINPKQIVGMCVSSQWSCTVPVDQNGEHLMNAISWMDSRGALYVQKTMHGLINISGYSVFKIFRWLPKTGGGPGLSGKGPVGHILFLKNERPEIYNETYKFLDAKDFLNFKLTGRCVASYDSNHLLWVLNIKNLNNIFYEDKLIKILGLDKEKLPNMIRSIDVVGNIKPEIADELGLPRNLKIICGSPDLHTAAIGSGAVEDFHAHIYIGTSSWVISHVPFKKTDIFHNIASVPSANPSKYMVVSEQETAGACLTFLRDNIVFKYSNDDKPHEYSELDEIANKVPAGSSNLIFTPWLFGERTPIEDEHVRGGFHNLSLNHDIDHCVRAVFEGVAFNSKWVFYYVEKFCGKKLDLINLIGGGANSNVWCQIYADILNRTIRKVKDPIQANARGAAFIVAIGLGYLKFEDIPKYITYEKIFKPNPDNRKIYDKIYKAFLSIYKKNRKIYKFLNTKNTR